MTLKQAIDNVEEVIKTLNENRAHGEAMECLQLKHWLEELLACRVKSGLYTKNGSPMGEINRLQNEGVTK